MIKHLDSTYDPYSPRDVYNVSSAVVDLSRSAMSDEVLRKYGLNEPYPELWQDADSSATQYTTSANESDAFGTGQSVFAVLQERGVLRNEPGVPQEYSLNSKQFNARAYIRDVHRKATQNDLRQGQEYLNKAIDSKSGSLKVLVEENFDRFVGSKRVIDSVYAQLSSEFSRKDQSASRMDRIRESLNDTSARAAQVFEPVIDNRRKSDKLRATLGILEQYQAHFDLPSKLIGCIERNDNDALIREYKKGQTIFKDVRRPTTALMSTAERRNARLLSRVWSVVERIMRTHELDVWRLLDEQEHTDNTTTARLANFLLDLGVDSNPYYRAYNQNIRRIMEATTMNLEVDRTQVEILRRKSELKNVLTKQQKVNVLRAFIDSENSPSETVPNIIQSQEMLGFWDSVTQLVHNVWTKQVSEIVENWRIVQDMTSGRPGKLLPNGPDGQSRRFHSFTAQERGAAVDKAEAVLKLVCESITHFFVSAPIDKLPAIYSPTSTTTPGTLFSPINLTDEIPELPDLGDRKLAEFSFIPESVNSLGACMHLQQLKQLLKKGVFDLENLHISGRVEEILRTMISTVRERFIRAVCELWQADSDLIPELEDWKKIAGSDSTALPKSMSIVHKAVIEGLRKIAFNEGQKSDIMKLPSARLVGNVRQQFYKNLFQIINGLMARSASSDAEEVVSIEIRKLIILSNLNTIQTTTLISLVQQFEHSFSTSFTDDLHKLNQMLSSYDQKLFSNYTRPHLSQLEAIIQHSLIGLDWSTLPYPTGTDDYTNKVILHIVVVHAELTATSHASAPRILPFLIISTFRLLQTHLSQIQIFSVGATLQLTLDLELLSYAFGSYIDSECNGLLESIFTLIESRTDKNRRVAGVQPDMKKILVRARKGIASQARVFRKDT